MGRHGHFPAHRHKFLQALRVLLPAPKEVIVVTGPCARTIEHPTVVEITGTILQNGSVVVAKQRPPRSGNHAVLERKVGVKGRVAGVGAAAAEVSRGCWANGAAQISWVLVGHGGTPRERGNQSLGGDGQVMGMEVIERGRQGTGGVFVGYLAHGKCHEGMGVDGYVTPEGGLVRHGGGRCIGDTTMGKRDAGPIFERWAVLQSDDSGRNDGEASVKSTGDGGGSGCGGGGKKQEKKHFISNLFYPTVALVHDL